LGGYSGDAIAQYLISKNFEVDLTTTDAQNVRKLVAGRIDFWATGKYSGATLATREKAADIRPVMTFNTTFMYLACHSRMDDRTVALLNSTLDRMRKDGTVAKITARYHQD
jgi:polar amino acid transport system substrate-binding protein